MKIFLQYKAFKPCRNSAREARASRHYPASTLKDGFQRDGSKCPPSLIVVAVCGLMTYSRVCYNLINRPGIPGKLSDMVQIIRDVFVILFGIMETEVSCHVLSCLPEQIAHDE